MPASAAPGHNLQPGFPFSPWRSPRYGRFKIVCGPDRRGSKKPVLALQPPNSAPPDTTRWDLRDLRCNRPAGRNPARLGSPSEQIRVRSRADEVRILAIDLADRQPIRLDGAVAKIQQQQDDLAQLRHVLAALLREFHIALELRATDRATQGLDSHFLRTGRPLTSGAYLGPCRRRASASP